jgi:hypothetical protein
MSAFRGKADTDSHDGPHLNRSFLHADDAGTCATEQRSAASIRKSSEVSKAIWASRGRWRVQDTGRETKRASAFCKGTRDVSRPRCFTSVQEDTGEYGSIRSPLVKHFACRISAIRQNDWNVRFWPKADIPSCTAHVRVRG